MNSRFWFVMLLLAGVYVWQNDGLMHRVWREIRSVAGGPESGRQVANHPQDQPSVVLLATNWCGYCKKMRAWFDQEGIRYTEYNVERPDGEMLYKRYQGNGVPIVIVGEEAVIHGYNPDEVADALGAY